jgi:hypothetical protein
VIIGTRTKSTSLTALVVSIIVMTSRHRKRQPVVRPWASPICDDVFNQDALLRQMSACHDLNIMKRGIMFLRH